MLNGRGFVEQIRLVVDTADVAAQALCFTRVAELNKKGYKLVDSAIQESEQFYYFEQEKEKAGS